MTMRTMLRRWPVPLCLALLLAGLMMPDPAAYAATPLHVTNCTDTGISADGSLRGEIVAASAGDSIVFDLNCTITLATGTLKLSKDVTIDGTGHKAVVDGAGALTVFQVNVGVTAALNGLTIQHGYADGDCQFVNGGGIKNLGTLAVSSSTVADSYTNCDGGGIYNANGAALTVTNSSFSGNTAGGSGGGISSPGCIDLCGIGTAHVTVTNTTFSGNIANAPGAVVSGGGAIFDSGTELTITNTIFAHSVGVGGSLVIEFATATGSNNLADDDSVTQIGGSNNRRDTLLLGSLGGYGGTTQTFSLLPGSPAIDAGDDATCTAAPPNGAGGTDQRGISRSQGAHCDIGAFESQGFSLIKTSGDAQSTLISTDFASPLTVTVASTHSEPVSGKVTFTIAPSAGALATFNTQAHCTLSNGNLTAVCGISAGIATSPTFTAGSTPGGFTATAAASGASVRTFMQTVTAPNGVTGISPSSGSAAGGNRVTIMGGSFGTIATTQVLLDGIAIPAASIVSVSGTQIVFVAPAHAAGGVTVTVTVNGTPLAGSVTYTYGVATTLPGGKPTGGAQGSPSMLPGPRPAGMTGQAIGAAPTPLPSSRP